MERDINTKVIVESFEQSASDESEQAPKSKTSKRKFITWDGWNGGEKTRTGTVIAALTAN